VSRVAEALSADSLGSIHLETSTTELGWFRAELFRSIVAPRTFARELAREHFGLAGVLVALIAGMALSISVDALVLATKGMSPAGFVARLVIDAFLLGVRIAIAATVVATVVWGGLRLLRREEITLDQSFTAIAFALSPLVIAPIAAVLVTLDPSLLVLAGVVFGLVAVRALLGILLNVGAILPRPLAAIALVLIVISGWFSMQDQISRVRFTAYAIAPQLAPALAAAPARGKTYQLEGATLAAPNDWEFSVRGVPGEIAHLEIASATLNIVRGRPDPLATLDSLATTLARSERLGFSARRDERSVVLLGGHLTVDDRADGAYEGRHIALRQFTVAEDSAGLALQFRFFDPPDVEAAFAQAAAIAATLRIVGREAQLSTTEISRTAPALMR